MSEFSKPLPEWNLAAIKPAQAKLDGGWEAQEKPPASVLNWWQNTSYQALKELQTKAESNEELKVYKSDYDAANDIYVTVEKHRQDGTLKEKAVLGGYDAPTKRYTTRTITRYGLDGTTVTSGYPITKNITYDAKGNVMSEV